MVDYLEAVLEEGARRSLDTPEKHSSRTVRDHRGRYPLLDDEDLMLLVEGGDADAFAALYDRHCRLAYSVAHKLTGEKHSAEDLTQEAFLKVWRSADGYRPQGGSVRSWILSVVRNQGIDQLRAKASRRRMQEKLEASAPRSEPCEALTQVWHEARLDRVRKALDALPHFQQQVLALAHFSDLTHREIAERFRLPLGTVKGRMRLGLVKLRKDTDLRDVAAGLASLAHFYPPYPRIGPYSPECVEEEFSEVRPA